MRIVLSILLLFCFSAYSQNKVPVFKGTLNRTTPLLIVIYGESNSGGRASNSDATATELGVRTGTKILNNWTLEFESLHIGVNNLIGHYGLEDLWYTAHGFELQIANMVAAGELPTPTYIVKCGQGGTKAEQLKQGGSLYSGKNPWDTMTKRVDAAIAEIESIEEQSPQIYVFYSQGLNNIPDNTPAIWIADSETIMEDFRTLYGATIPFFMTKFNMTGQTGYNDEIQTMCNGMPLCYFISSDGAEYDGVLHWEYEGMKLVSKRLVNKLRSSF